MGVRMPRGMCLIPHSCWSKLLAFESGLVFKFTADLHPHPDTLGVPILGQRERESCVAQKLGRPAFKKMGGPCQAWWSKGLDWSWRTVGV